MTDRVERRTGKPQVRAVCLRTPTWNTATMSKRDYYEVLGVARDASDET
jgi:hypothetical protein